MTSAALLFATLIGIFITPDGIVVGSDSALSDSTGQVGSQQKYCLTGPRSVATFQGTYTLRETETKAALELYGRFRELCSQTVRLAVAPREQARYIANELKNALVEFLERLPGSVVVREYSSNPVVVRIAVSGYGQQGPESVVVGVGIATDTPANRWEAQVRDLPRLTFATCGTRFHGQEVVVQGLGRDTDARIPRAERQKQNVANLSALVRGNCGAASVRTATAMFVDAARLTVTLGHLYGIPAGAVGLPLDVIAIPRDGTIDVTHVPSW